MKTNKNGLDEMQREKRNTIGNQMFMLMFYALLIDCGLYGAGIRWLAYPSNVMVIMMVCMGIYLAKMIAANAYLPPKAQTRRPALIVAAVVLSAVLAAAAFYLIRNLSGQRAPEDTGDNSALILFIVSAAGLLISAIAAIIKKVRDRNDGDE